MGIVAYPGHGIYQSIRVLVKSDMKKQVANARRGEGEYLSRNTVTVDVPLVLGEFDRLLQVET